MKPSELAPLVGQRVECYWHGLRVGRVIAAPATDTITVELGRYGHHRIATSSVRGVFVRRKLRTLPEWYAARAAKAGAS